MNKLISTFLSFLFFFTLISCDSQAPESKLYLMGQSRQEIEMNGKLPIWVKFNGKSVNIFTINIKDGEISVGSDWNQVSEYPQIAYIKEVTSVDKIDLSEYASKQLEYRSSTPITENGAYSVKMKGVDPIRQTAVNWVFYFHITPTGETTCYVSYKGLCSNSTSSLVTGNQVGDGDNQGNDTPGGNNPGGNDSPDDDTPKGDTPGDGTSGGEIQGGDNPGGNVGFDDEYTGGIDNEKRQYFKLVGEGECEIKRGEEGRVVIDGNSYLFSFINDDPWGIKVSAVHAFGGDAEIVYIGQVKSIEDIPYENFDSKSLTYHESVNFKENGGYIVKVKELKNIYIGEETCITAAWVHKIYKDKIRITYKVYKEDY